MSGYCRRALQCEQCRGTLDIGDISVRLTDSFGAHHAIMNASTLRISPGKRAERVSLLTQHNAPLRELGCSIYEVAINAHEPDTVFVVEFWTNAEAHRAP